MSNMTFGTNILPANGNNSLTLGNSGQKWNLYASTINGNDASAIPGKYDFTATIPATGWSTYSNTDLKTSTVTVNGLAVNDNIIMGVVQTGTESTDSAVREAFGLLVRGTTAANAITLYATDVPEVAIPIMMVVLR